MTSEIARLQHRFGTVEVIENETVPIPGSINTYQLRAQNPARTLQRADARARLTGRYPTGPDEVAVTSGVASAFT